MKSGDRVGVMRGGLPYIGEFHSPAKVDVIIGDDTKHIWIQPYDKVSLVNKLKWRTQ